MAIWTDCIGPDKDQLVMGKLLIPIPLALRISRLPYHGPVQIDREYGADGSFIGQYTNPADLAMAAAVVSASWGDAAGVIPEECFFCGDYIAEEDIEISMGSDQPVCSRCHHKEQMDDDGED